MHFGSLHPRDRAALKTAFRTLVERLGGIEAAASCTRVHPSKIAEYYSPTCPLRWAPCDVIADLEAVAEQPIVTAVLARIQGYTLLPTPKASTGPIGAQMAAILTETAEASADYMRAMEDGRITDAERAALAAHASEALRHWHQVAAACAPGGAA